jgi:hypothetical protein
MSTPKDVLSSLSDYQAWAKGGELSMFEYAQCIGTPDLWCMLIDFAEPELVQHRGDYFYASGFSLEVYEEWSRELDDPREIQRVMNHVHVGLLVQGSDVPDHVIAYIARGIARLWCYTLQGKGLVAEAYGEGASSEVTFFKRRLD